MPPAVYGRIYPEPMLGAIGWPVVLIVLFLTFIYCIAKNVDKWANNTAASINIEKKR